MASPFPDDIPSTVDETHFAAETARVLKFTPQQTERLMELLQTDQPDQRLLRFTPEQAETLMELLKNHREIQVSQAGVPASATAAYQQLPVTPPPVRVRNPKEGGRNSNLQVRLYRDELEDLGQWCENNQISLADLVRLALCHYTGVNITRENLHVPRPVNLCTPLRLPPQGNEP